MSTANERLAELRIALGFNRKAEFAEVVGIERSTYDKLEKGPNKPSIDSLERILFKFPNVSANWLISGLGVMFFTVPDSIAEQHADLIESMKNIPTPAQALQTESETLLKLAVAEAELKAARQQLEEKRVENGWLREMLGKPLSSLEAALRSLLTHGATPAPLSMAA